MIGRCSNPANTSYKNYGARGVRVCERWKIFENFYADVGDAPTPAHTIDRIDSRGDYEPGNVRWATRLEQTGNRSCTLMVYLNEEHITLKEASIRCGLAYHTVWARVARFGWPVSMALTIGSNTQNRHPVIFDGGAGVDPEGFWKGRV
jgi:hypothetical protein